MRVTSAAEDKGLNIAGRSGPNRERSIFATSVDKATAGKHPTRITCDDLSNEQNSQNQSQRDKVIRSYEQLTPIAKDMNCPIRVVGTPWSIGDLSDHLRSELNVPTFRRPCWGGEAPAGYDPERDGPPPGPVDVDAGETGWPLCEGFYTAEQLHWLTDPGNPKRISNEFYNAQYRLNPIPAENAWFTNPILDAATWGELAELPEGGYEVGLIDPAFSSKGTGDSSGIVIYRVYRAKDLGMDPQAMGAETNIYVPTECVRVPGALEACIRAVEGLCDGKAHRGRLRAFLLENVAAQTAVIPWIKPLPGGVRLIKTKYINNSKGQEWRIMGLKKAMLQSRVILPPQFPGRDLLISECRRWPMNKKHDDDVLDAAALVSMLPREGAPYEDPNPEPPKPQTLAWSDEYLKRNAGVWG